ncbi:MAG TPA: GntR family transcriptional regulator [Polyangiaceae bacterium]
MLEINTRSSVPIYEQIVAQLREAVTSGALEPGTSLPTIRQLARDLGLNPATVAKAYQLLEKDGVLEASGRRGTFVRGDARPRLDETLRKEAGDQLRDLLARWKARGLEARDLRQLCNELLAAMEPKRSNR